MSDPSALLIVDMQNDFLLRAIQPTISMIEKCWEERIQVNEVISRQSFGLLNFRSFGLHGASPTVTEPPCPPPSSASQPGLLGVGFGPNGDIPPSLKAHVQPQDIACPKNRVSEFVEPRAAALEGAIESQQEDIVLCEHCYRHLCSCYADGCG